MGGKSCFFIGHREVSEEIYPAVYAAVERHVEEFIRANCEYPGEWDGEVEKVITTDMHIITATHVFSKDGSISCHATSFIRVVDGKIASVDEYWGDDGAAPQWRQDKHIGITIKE